MTDLNTFMTHTGRFEFPPDFPPEGVRRAQVDAEIIATKLRDNPDEMRALLQAVGTGQGEEAHRLVGELGLTESDFQKQGGGILWGVVIIGVLCCASEAY